METIPRGTSIPYLLILNTGPTLTIHRDGRILIGLGSGPITAARLLKTLLSDQFLGRDVPVAEYRRSVSSDRIRYGTQGVVARERVNTSVFRVGGTSQRW